MRTGEPLMKWYESNEAKRPDVIVYDADSFCGADLAEKFGIARVARVGTGLRNILVAGLDVPPNGAGVSIFEMYAVTHSNSVWCPVEINNCFSSRYVPGHNTLGACKHC